MGKELGETQEWNDKEEDVMFATMLRKFDGDKTLLAKLLATSNKSLVEATPDKKWGDLLMQVRDKLRAEREQKQNREREGGDA